MGDILASGAIRATSTSSGIEQPDADSEPPPPACPKCDGAGFVRQSRPVGHPEFGQAVPCRCSEAEAEDERQARLQRYSNLGPLTKLTFAAVEPDRSPPFAEAFRTARAYARDPQGWLVLWGRSGTGKTALAAAMATDRIASGQPALYLVVPDLLDHLRAAYQPDADLPYQRLFDQVRNALFLILDDVDAGNPTPWAQEKFFQLLNHRFMAELPTVILTSHPPSELPDRLSSRLGNERLVRIQSLEASAASAYRQIGGMTEERLQQVTFDRFKPEGHELIGEEAANLTEAYRTARRYAEQPEGWLTFIGANGCGKTHLAAAIAGARLAAGDAVYFAVVPDLLDYLRSTFDPSSSASYDEVFEALRTGPFLILDDLGAHSTSPWAEEKLYQIFSYRYIHSLPTVITTNCNLEDLDDRLASRLLDYQQALVFRIQVADYRTGTIGRRETGRRGARPRRRR